MSRTIGIAELSDLTGISRRTLLDVAHREPDLVTIRPDGTHFIIDRLAQKPGMGIIATLTLADGQRWIKVVELARMSGIPRRTLANWAQNRPNFACRIGRIWYIRLETLGASPEQRRFFERWMNHQHSDSGKDEKITEDQDT